MATSRTPSMSFLGSMTWPPFSTRSYCAAASLTKSIARSNPRCRLRTDDALPLLVPGHVFALAIRLHSHGAGHHAVVAQHAVALEWLVFTDGVLQVAMMRLGGFRACFLVHDLLGLLGES